MDIAVLDTSVLFPLLLRDTLLDIAHARLYVVRGVAHGLMAEAPNGFNDAVLRFIDEVDEPAAQASA